MASIATVVTMGYGSFGSVDLLPTIGYATTTGIGDVRWGVDAADIYCGNGRVAVVYSGRSTAQDTFTANAKTAQVNR